MDNLLLAIKDVLEWHDENLSDNVNRENVIRRLRAEFEAAQQSAHPTDGGLAQSDSESKPAAISG